MAARSTLLPSPMDSGGHHDGVHESLSSSPSSFPSPSSRQVPPQDTTKAAAASTTKTRPRQRPLKQKMALSLKSLVSSAQKLVLGDSSSSTQSQSQNTPSSPSGLFPATDPAVDGDDCDQDCHSCSIKYPRDFKIDEADELYGHVKGWSTHVLVATGKSDWVRDVADEKGSVMEALEKYTSSSSAAAAEAKKGMGKMMLSASNIPTPHGTTDYSEPTTVVLLPAFAVIHNVSPATVPALVDRFVSQAATSTTPLTSPVSIPRSIPLDPPSAAPTSLEAALTATPSPHNVLILLCSQKTRDARCGQSAPLLKRELERHLRPLGLYRDADDHRPGGVGIYFISHVGGHKYSANMMVYRRRDAYGVDGVDRAAGEFKIDPLARFKREVAAAAAAVTEKGAGKDLKTEEKDTSSSSSSPAAAAAAAAAATQPAGDNVITDEGAAQCIWLARIKPEDCENVVRYTVLQGRVVKPDSQLRGGFDRGKGLVSW